MRFINLIFVLSFTLLLSCTHVTRLPERSHNAGEVHQFFLEILHAKNIDEEAINKCLASRLKVEQYAEVACIGKVMAERNTEMNSDEVEAARRMGLCFVASLKKLNEENAISELRRIYFSVRISDGWLDQWNHLLGRGWEKRLHID